jgi:hypothetical protein
MSLRRLPVLVLPVLALVAGGCGASNKDSAKDFKGEPKQVATAIEDLQTAGSKRDASKICGELLSTSLVAKIEQAAKSTGKSTCTAAVKESLKDVDAFELQVVKNGIAITGTTATAKVKSSSGTNDDKIDTLQLVKEKQRQGGKDTLRWKISALAG